MAGQSEVTPALLGELWDLVEEWSSAAIQRARDAASTGSSEVADAEIRIAIAHAAELRAVVERHLADAEPVPGVQTVREEEAAPARTPGTLHEPPRAQVCPECFVMVPLDQLEEHDLTCERHHKIERMEQAGLGDPSVDDTAPEEAAAAPGDEEPPTVDEPLLVAAAPAMSTMSAAPAVLEPASGAVVAPPASDHTCNSADFERPLCDTCGGLHWYCSICGAQRDACRPAAAR
ncbi:hypothetical protein [Nocardioides jiangxiensis]|uniref:Uncharacterized protein n=1 Tax=Nocardioides jiangxiensis TaxID=3064524 RepID=A0ABT9B0H7_9ACTN|nr:hypothetical protein [Nocardioides sp. WY-20]MDO7868356.1 hypothetical protein [Nocardioides sp. WY-20]